MDIKSKSLFNKAVNLVTLASFLMWNMAFAAPVGGSVAQGSATIAQGGTQTTIVQTTPNAVINWQGFNTAANESINFYQPGSSSVVLNRITSGTPTSFAGQLTANGQVWILNPAGVLFTSTSKIDVAGLVATTLNISDSNFMSHNYQLSQSPHVAQSSVINNGLITAHDNGLVALVAPTVENNGTIVANMGNVLLASGTIATLDPYGDSLINFAPNNYAVEGSVTNNGSISTNGGKVVMAANSVNKIIKNVVNNGGIIEAKNIAQGADGVIILGGNSGTTNIGGKITSNKIMIKGHDTVISGQLKAEDVGSIETSGDTVTFSPGYQIDAGKGGLWYLDPLTINISDYNGLVQSQLQAGTNVTLSTGTNLSIAGTGDINVDQAISWNTGATLYLGAYRNINVSQPLSSNGGSVVMRADMANNKSGNVVFSGAAAVAGANVMNGGSIKIYYNPSNYNNPIDYKSSYFSGSSAVTGFMMVDNQTDFLNMVSTQSPSTLYNYSLNTDIDATGFANIFTLFNGSFDGYDYATGVTHTISNVNFTAGSFWIGGIAWVNAGTIQNVNLVNATINPVSPVTTEIGGIVGENQGTISNVSYQGTVASGSAFSAIGGIVGYNVGAISYATFNGTAFVPAASSSIGGIAGVTTGTINYAGVIGGTIFNFSGNGQTGGIAGRVAGTGSSCNSSGAICNSFNTALVVGSGTTGTFLAPTGGIVGQKDPGTTAYIHYVYNTGSVLAWPGIPATNVGPILGDALGGGGATFITGWYYDISTCSSCSTLWGSGSLFSFPDANKTLQSSYQQGVPADHFDFTNIWTTNGNTTTPQLKPLVLPVINTVLGSGALSVASSQPVSIYANGVLQSTVNSNASGGYVFSYDPNIDFSSQSLLATTNAAVKGTTLKTASSTNPITGLNITNNQVVVDSTTMFSNSNLAAASVNTPYSAVGNNLTLNSGVNFLTTAQTPYNLNGNITTSGGADISFGNTVSLGANSILTSGGIINFSNTVDGGFALTTNAAGAVTFGANVGGSSPLVSLSVSENGLIVPAGFIKVTGASSFSAGASAIDLSNPNNSFGGVLTLNNNGSGNDVTVNNSVATSLGASSIGGAFTLTSLNGITLNGSVTSGGSQDYNGNMLLNGNYAITSNTGNIDFDGTIDGGDNFTVSAPAGSITFGNNVGGTAFILSLTASAGGLISEGGFIHVTSGASFSSSSGGIDLTNAGNVFVGALSLTTTGDTDATVVNSIGTVLGVSSVDGVLTVTSNGNIIQTGALSVTGASSFDAGAGSIDLSNANNSLSGPISLHNVGNNNVDLNNIVATILAGSSIGGNLNVTSGGAISQTGPLTVNGTSNFDAGANAITLTNTGNDFAGALTLSNSGANDVQIYNNAPLMLTQFLIGGNITVTTDGSAITINGTGFSGGAQTYDDPLLLGSATNLTAGGNINFTTTLDGAGFNLTTNTPVSFDTQIHGNITNVNVLLVNGDVDINANVSTLSSQTYNGLVTLSTNANLNAVSGNIDFVNGIVGAGYDLSTTTASPFATVFDGPISGVNNLNVTGLANMNNGNVSTTGNQIYNGVVSLANNTNLSSSGGNIHFMTDIAGNGFNLSTTTVNPFSTIFDVNVNGVNNLTVDGVATFPNATAINASGTVSFDNALNGPGSVTITATDTQISGSVGGVPPLGAFTVNGPIEFNGGIINADTQTYNGVVTILSSLAPTVLSASGLIHFANSVEGPGSLTINAGALQFDAGVGDITPLDVLTLNAPVVLNGSSQINANTEIFSGAVTVNGTADINSSGTVKFLGTVDGPGSLTVDAANTIIEGIVGGTTPLSLLDIINGITLNGAQITANQVILEGPAVIGVKGAVIMSPDAEFLSTISGPGALSIIGNLLAAGDINLGSLSVTGTTDFNKGSLQSIITQGNQFYGDTVTLNNDALFITYQGVINFAGGGLYGPAYDVTIENFSHRFLNGIIGSVNVNNLTLGGTGGANLINSSFNSLNFESFSIGLFCVNGSCSQINMNTSAQQEFIVPDFPIFSSNELEIIPGYVGTVTDVTGIVEVAGANGIRIVMPGDVLFAGETILTGPDGKLCFVTVTKAKVCLGSSQEYKV